MKPSFDNRVTSHSNVLFVKILHIQFSDVLSKSPKSRTLISVTGTVIVLSDVRIEYRYPQCCGSMSCWCGSGSGSGYADSCLLLLDSDPDPAIFVVSLQDALLFEGTFFKYKKVKKKPQNSRNQGFSYFFCMMIEVFRSGSIPLTNGSVSRSMTPKNIRIRRIRIRNTGYPILCLFS
jgi:hypothetical protein